MCENSLIVCCDSDFGVVETFGSKAKFTTILKAMLCLIIISFSWPRGITEKYLDTVNQRKVLSVCLQSILLFLLP